MPECRDRPWWPWPGAPVTSTAQTLCPWAQELYLSSVLTIHSLPELCCRKALTQLLLHLCFGKNHSDLDPDPQTDLLPRHQTCLITPELVWWSGLAAEPVCHLWAYPAQIPWGNPCIAGFDAKLSSLSLGEKLVFLFPNREGLKHLKRRDPKEDFLLVLNLQVCVSSLLCVQSPYKSNLLLFLVKTEALMTF